MCLDISKKAKKLIATEDVVVYKVLTKRGDNYFTWYQDFPVKTGKIYRSRLVTTFFKNHGQVTIGLHSFATLGGAKSHGGNAIAKCIIPKGSEYYKGTFDDLFKKRKSIASNKLKYVEIIK